MIFVTRGIIVQNKRVLALQRSESMSLAFKWELPGGKLEEGEEVRESLVRETMEELCLEVEVAEALPPVDRLFRDRQYRMLPFMCRVTGGELEVTEHRQAVWQPIERLFELDWAPTELQIMRQWAAIHAPALLVPSKALV